MEYLPLENLACQDYITEEDNLQILCQGLQALEYLHSQSPPLAHRDIKLENVLVHVRIPFVIKLVDFGLARHDSQDLEIWALHCYSGHMVTGSSRITVWIRSPAAKPKARGPAVVSRYSQCRPGQGRERGRFDRSHLDQDAKDGLSSQAISK